jgi:hypothetical protein
MTWHGTARQGKDFESVFGGAGRGRAWQGTAGLGKARILNQHLARLGPAGQGWARQGFLRTNNVR